MVARPTVGTLGGWLCILFVSAIIVLATLFADRPEATISLPAGYLTFAIVAIAALSVGWISAFRRTQAAQLKRIDRYSLTWRSLFRGPAALVNALDHVAVRVVSALGGMENRSRGRRILCFLFVLSVVVSASITAGALIGAGLLLFAIAICVSVVRRWHWIEMDRDAFLVSRKSSSALLRLGFEHDLRAEALTAIVCLLLLIPLGFWQLERVLPGTFAGDESLKANLLIWIGFFGAELAKAVPFVDWSEVFHIANGSPIDPQTPLGAQTVFCVRAAIDLFLLSAVVQSVQIAGRTTEQLAAFRDKLLPILDPFVEREELGQLGLRLDKSHIDIAAELERYLHYDEERLIEILETSVPRSPASEATRRAALAISVYAQAPTRGHLLYQSLVGDTPKAEKRLATRLLFESDPSSLLTVVYRGERDGHDMSDLRESIEVAEIEPKWRKLVEFIRKLARNEVCTMNIVPGGVFDIGSPDSEADRLPSEGPRKAVAIREFELGRFPVTFDEYDAFCEAVGHSKPQDFGWGRENMPAIDVTWFDAGAFCGWLSIVTGRQYRLPSEAEWEYACRAGTESQYWFGSTVTKDQANFEPEFYTGQSVGQPMSVECFAPNPFGLVGMHGNVCEWCADIWDDDYNGLPLDGTPQMSGNIARRVVRGGSWTDKPAWLRSAARGRGVPFTGQPYIGFRIACTR